MPEEDLRVMVVDDTALYRRILTDALQGIPGVRVVDTAVHGKMALSKLEREPVDLLLLDVEMPVMGGLETLTAVRQAYPRTGVIMVSGGNRDSADLTVEALGRGAIDFVPKPSGSSIEESREMLLSHLQPLVKVFMTRRHLGTARDAVARMSTAAAAAIATAPPKPAAPPPEPMVRTAPLPKRIEVVAIGVSTGGPNALDQVIPKLPADLGVPVVLVQHMPPVFTKSLADHLAKRSQLDVREAVEGEPLMKNVVYIAPGGHHMVVRGPGSEGRGLRIGLNENPPENSCRPSVDVLFRSVAAVYQKNMLAVVMTGMGSDGREGVRVMKRCGCYCITQDKTSCVVYGMPMMVDQAGLSDESAPVDLLADRIVAAVRKGAPR